MFRKGVPSLFANMKTIFGNIEKTVIIGKTVEGYYQNLKAHGSFDGTSGTPSCYKAYNHDADQEPPSALLWVLYFLAQYYDRKGDTLAAIERVDEAITHTPTLVELYMLKARILKVKLIHGAIAQVPLARRGRQASCTNYGRSSSFGSSRSIH
jgi:peptide alpha-N-acetyltransferase